jgi:hypothetical protein
VVTILQTYCEFDRGVGVRGGGSSTAVPRVVLMAAAAALEVATLMFADNFQDASTGECQMESESETESGVEAEAGAGPGGRPVRLGWDNCVTDLMLVCPLLLRDCLPGVPHILLCPLLRLLASQMDMWVEPPWQHTLVNVIVGIATGVAPREFRGDKWSPDTPWGPGQTLPCPGLVTLGNVTLGPLSVSVLQRLADLVTMETAGTHQSSGSGLGLGPGPGPGPRLRSSIWGTVFQILRMLAALVRADPTFMISHGTASHVLLSTIQACSEGLKAGHGHGHDHGHSRGHGHGTVAVTNLQAMSRVLTPDPGTDVVSCLPLLDGLLTVWLRGLGGMVVGMDILPRMHTLVFAMVGGNLQHLADVGVVPGQLPATLTWLTTICMHHGIRVLSDDFMQWFLVNAAVLWGHVPRQTLLQLTSELEVRAGVGAPIGDAATARTRAQVRAHLGHLWDGLQAAMGLGPGPGPGPELDPANLPLVQCALRILKTCTSGMKLPEVCVSVEGFDAGDDGGGAAGGGAGGGVGGGGASAAGPQAGQGPEPGSARSRPTPWDCHQRAKRPGFVPSPVAPMGGTHGQAQHARMEAQIAAARARTGAGAPSLWPTSSFMQGFPGPSRGPAVAPAKPAPPGPVMCTDLSKDTVCRVVAGIIEWLKALGARVGTPGVPDPRGDLASELAATVADLEAIVKALDMVGTVTSPLDTALALLQAKNFGVTRACLAPNARQNVVECVVCKEDVPCYLMKPCNHLALCAVCIRDMERMRYRCPACRGGVSTWEKVFLP